MPRKDSMTNPRKNPTKEDLKEFLGVARYRRFKLIYDELANMKYAAKMVWHEPDKHWIMRFYYSKIPLFSIHWGVDNFYAGMVLKNQVYQQLLKQDGLSRDTQSLLEKCTPNRMKGTTRVEANLEMMKENEGFFGLLPMLIKS